MGFLAANLAITALALTLEGAAGYPKRVYAAIGHPVVWVGTLIARLDRGWNRDGAAASSRKAAGTAALATIILITAAATVPVALACRAFAHGWLLEALLAGTLLAQRSLLGHVAGVAEALSTGGVTAGRQAVAQIVGRDPTQLDTAGVSRAAIESLAENLSDGVVAPAFWLAVGGLPGIALYKAINTADSMIGHRTARHGDFGWAAARVDDAVNLIPARLTALLLAAAAALLPGGNPRAALWAPLRDAGRHQSPNAGWPEATTAGALGLRLNGPKRYGDTFVDDAWMGRGRADAGPADIRNALQLSRMACVLLFGLAAILWWIVG